MSKAVRVIYDFKHLLCSFCSSKEDSKESSFSGAGRSDSLFCAAALLAKVKTCAVMLPQLRTTARINKTNEFTSGHPMLFLVARPPTTLIFASEQAGTEGNNIAPPPPKFSPNEEKLLKFFKQPMSFS